MRNQQSELMDGLEHDQLHHDTNSPMRNQQSELMDGLDDLSYTMTQTHMVEHIVDRNNRGLECTILLLK